MSSQSSFVVTIADAVAAIDFSTFNLNTNPVMNGKAFSIYYYYYYYSTESHISITSFVRRHVVSSLPLPPPISAQFGAQVFSLIGKGDFRSCSWKWKANKCDVGFWRTISLFNLQTTKFRAECERERVCQERCSEWMTEHRKEHFAFCMNEKVREK